MRMTFAMLLALAMLLSLLPGTALAQSTQYYPLESLPVERHTGRSGFNGLKLANGHHAAYIDRLTELPDYAYEFYAWLEDNANAQGALADPTLGIAYDEDYYHVVTHISNSRTFTYTTEQEREEKVESVAMEAMDEELVDFGHYAGAIYDVFDRDHPEVFWLTGKSTYSSMGYYYYSYIGNTCTVYYELDMIFWLRFGSFDLRNPDYRSPQAVAEGIALRDACVEGILSGCTSNDPFEQVRYLNKTLTERNAYNQAGGEGRWEEADPEAWECISALTGRSGDWGPVCEGYARAFMLLCQRLEIPCVLVDGPARSEPWEDTEDHMWNYVNLKGNWYAVDVTWNDPFISDMPEVKHSGFESERWLLLGADTWVATDMDFLQSHVVENDIGGDGFFYTNGPELSSERYDPQAVQTYSLRGTVTSFGDAAAAVTLELYRADQLVQTQTVTGTKADYLFEELLPGEYTLKLSKADHVSRSLSFTLTDTALELNTKLHLLGDLSGDGRVNVADVGRLYSHIRGASPITDPYILACADLTGDGRLNVADTGRLYAKVRG